MHSYRVFILDSRTENPCVGGSIPPLGTINIYNFKYAISTQEGLAINIQGELES